MLDISKLLTVMTEHEASDLYLTVDSPPMYRINGVVRPAGNRCLQPDDTRALAYSVMTDKQQREFDEESEMNLALYYPALGRFRVNIFIQRACVGMVIRQIRSDILTIDDLDLPQVMKDVSMTKRGLVLVVGATGSGKSTTLAAMIDYRNSNSAGHIITIEDPIEFIHGHKKSIVTQREVGVDTHNFQIALKNTLRQAPDVILIGEIRDQETMEAAITFAETGHLCLATLHSNNANQAMERVMNFFPPERHAQIYLQLSLNLRGIVSQRLVRRKDGGRIAAIEVLLDSPRVKDLIHKAQIAELKEAMEKSTNAGMQTFDQALYDHYKAGVIHLDEALKNADSANNLRLRVKLSEDGDSFEKGGQSKKKEKTDSVPAPSAVEETPDEENRVSSVDDEVKLTLDM
ncbi:MAG: PilT/PilU family type 4a pilus ATPase [Bdellovibrionales bacterium]|nr:PilT/PilU family type 4a pilus ATPase [Bdellovibrionales bacterium]